MNQVRCKMLCTKFEKKTDTSSAHFMPVTQGSKENEEFFKYTPAGELHLELINDNIVFEMDKEYYIDITEA